MSVNDAPAGDTGGPSGEPAQNLELPAKMRVHALAKLLGRASRDVLGALTTLGHEVRSVQSSITREIAEQAVAALAPAPADGAAEPAEAIPAEPVEPPATGRRKGRARSAASAAANPFGLPAEDPRPAPAEPAAVAPAFAVPMFQAPTAPPAPAPAAAGGPDEPETGAKKGRKSRRKRDADAAQPEDEATGTPATGADRADDRADSDDSEDTADRADAGDADDDEDGNARRRRRRGRRGRGRGKGGDEPGENEQDAGDTPDGDATERDGDRTDTGSDSGADSGDADDSDGTDGDDEQSPGSRRRRRRRRKGGSDVEGRSEDDPPNTVTKVREARSDSGSSSDDQVQGVRGSTRLEAKRQRRRDGRDAGRRRPPILSESEFLARRESVDRQMVIRQLADRTEIGVLEDSVLVEHFITGGGSGSASMVGNIYLGRVQNVLPSMEAAFVDIGRGRNAVLYAGEVNWDAAGLNGKARKIEQALSSGDQVLVQVTKDPVGHKGARLTTQISLAGRFLVYVPSGGAAGISRKLPDTERKRLKEMLKEIVPAEAGVIIRTASEGVSHESLERDVRRLQAQWEVVKEKSEKTGKGAPKAPTLLYEEPDMLVKVVRDQFNEDFSKLIVSGNGAWETVSGYVDHVAPELSDRMHRHTGPSDVFTEYRIDEQLLKALDRKVWLPSGGTLVIDRTEAMTVVDVNTGKFTGSGGNLEETVTRNNLEAAEEVVRQLRLRDIGGIIVVDFIDMVLEANRDLVLRRLTECLARDRTRHQVAEVTSLGLVQMTRKRVGGGLLEHFSTPCEHCRGRGVIVSTDQAEPQHHHGGGHGRGDNGNGNGRSNNGNDGNGDGGGRRRRRRGGNGDSGADDAVHSDRNGNGNGGNGDSGADPADRPVDVGSAMAGVAAVAAGRTARGDDGGTAGADPAGNGVAPPAPSAGTSDAPGAGATTAADAAPAPVTDPGSAAVPEPVQELTGSADPVVAAPAPVADPVPEPSGAGTGRSRRRRKRDAEETPAPDGGATATATDGATPPVDTVPAIAAPAPAETTDAERPAPRRRRVSRSAGSPTTTAEPVVITTAPAEQSAPVVAAATAPGAAASSAAVEPVTGSPVPEQPEAAAAARPRRRRRAASRPAGPPQDGG
ncbi:translation initiation factor IF-2 N-terminal domain-containing protein [Pseudonocardia sp. HH130630-07]|uniref:translation initiation factor IF-2 N-terminal domain-containing protein n=1 Tax=Pseudonocardia sp. HH130630-07 TaxID=1690815 RepID=UPI0008153E02|nr:translation initiation factor IF-2 N-terminal domain-containing protein [Pseudonocardia sp. HH130630-07]ANY05464.1 hypothetical protein AFB00_03115 [Pseudonocardia sp. HH130630-07]